MKGVLKDQYTARWDVLIGLIVRDSNWSEVQTFTVRYMLQSAVHMLWMERNKRRQGEASTPAQVMIRRLDKNMRNIFTVIRRREDMKYEEGMRFWFDTR